jgi:HEAT repeat protein
MITRMALLATVTALLGASVDAADSSKDSAKLITVLQSNATLYEKARACQQLGEIGNRDAVPALAALLPDPQLNAYARSGLEGIPDPAAATALREAAAKLKGPLLAGVINSLGVLRDQQAVELLSKMASAPTSGVVSEALLALGNISSPESIRIVQHTLTNGSESFRSEAAAACLWEPTDKERRATWTRP